MLRQPDVSESQIVFVYAGDLWVVPKNGGTAQRLSSPPGEESLPRFSPDGRSIAFHGNYDGNLDVYVIPSSGGIPRRITHHPMPDRMLDWYPDGRALLFASMRESGRQRFRQLFKVSREGGLPEKLIVPFGEFGTLSPDGRKLAYIPISRDYRTWKRYRGGMAPDIWLFDLETYESENLTQSDANDAHPMWHGGTLYFLSDRGLGQRSNIWACDLESRDLRQVTRFTDFDVHFPAIGPAEIVFEAGGRLHLLDLADETYREVPVEVVTDQRTLKPRRENVSRLIENAWISPSGKRAVFEARGELFTVPEEHGVILNLSRDSGVAERTPAWSPDGSYLAYWSDRSGEYQLCLRRADGSGDEETLTNLGAGFRYRPYWSPDSRRLAFVDQAQRIWLLDRESRELTQVDQGLWMRQGALSSFRVSWSPDSRWMAYSRGIENSNGVVFLYDTKNGTRHQVTSGFYECTQPVFDPEGKYLYYLTNRSFAPVYSDFDNSWTYPNATRVAAVPLRSDVPSPLAPRNDEEPLGEEEGEKKPESGKEPESGSETEGGEGGSAPGSQEPAEGGEAEEKESSAKEKEVDIDLEGFEARSVVLPPPAGNYGGLQAASGKVVYLRRPRSGSEPDAKSSLVFYDLGERKEKEILAGVNAFLISFDSKKALVQVDQSFAIISVAPGQKVEKKLRTSELESEIDPRAEWRQMFKDAWRLQRDFFYDPGMHGVDWEAMRQHYGRLLEDAVTRWDVNYVLGELIAELNASHTYIGGGDQEHSPRESVGQLGIDWSLENGAYRVKRIVRGAPWDVEGRSPLDEPGLDIREGDYILAVNGIPLDTSADPWASFQGLGEKTVMLTVSSTSSLEGSRTVLVETLADESDLRHREWIESNRRRVEEASEGRLGYVYVPSTGRDGQAELVRQFYAQFHKKGLIIDERFNSGGQIPDRFIEVLDRRPLSFWAVRTGKDWQWPPVAHFGPKAMLINGWSGSGGDAFPYYFRERGLGPLIGTTTWGGLIGISGAPGLVDGGTVTVPTFRMYSVRGKWFEEGGGVEPDIEVVEDPTVMARGRDPQLERAIEEVIRLLSQNPPVEPDRPSYERRVAP